MCRAFRASAGYARARAREKVEKESARVLAHILRKCRVSYALLEPTRANTTHAWTRAHYLTYTCVGMRARAHRCFHQKSPGRSWKRPNISSRIARFQA